MAKELDPEVQALLNENPATLPDALVREGWGQHTMRQAERWGTGERKKPATKQQPVYTHACHQCGRPITMVLRNGRWRDHAGKFDCEGGLLPENLADYHFTEAELEEVKTSAEKDAAYAAKQQSKHKARQAALANASCGAVRHMTKKGTHHHICDEKTGHFGFHMCRECRHLWR